MPCRDVLPDLEARRFDDEQAAQGQQDWCDAMKVMRPLDDGLSAEEQQDWIDATREHISASVQSRRKKRGLVQRRRLASRFTLMFSPALQARRECGRRFRAPQLRRLVGQPQRRGRTARRTRRIRQARGSPGREPDHPEPDPGSAGNRPSVVTISGAGVERTQADTRLILVTTDPVHALIPLPAARELLGISRSSMTRIIRAGELPVIAIGRRLLVAPEDLAEFVAVRRRLGSGGRERPGVGKTAPTNDDGPVDAEPYVGKTADAGRDQDPA